MEDAIWGFILLFASIAALFYMKLGDIVDAINEVSRALRKKP